MKASLLPVLAMAVLASCGGGSGGAPQLDPGPPPPQPGAPLLQYALDRLNDYRILAGVPELALDVQLNAFAQEGSEQLAQDHVPHAHFEEALEDGTLFTTDGFQFVAGENQGPAFGHPPRATVEEQIDEILEAMFEEGPGPGHTQNHYDNIVNPVFERLGVGLFLDADGRLYFTNDFSG